MHGMLMLAYRRFLTDRFGDALAGQVFSGLESLDPKAVYQDDRFFSLLQDGSQRTKIPGERLLREFGAHTVMIFHELYPAYFASAGAKSFLLQVESLIHARIRESVAGAQPPQLRIEEVSRNQLRIEYTSARKLCVMLAGLLDGTSIHYQTPMRYREERCMLKGETSCIFQVTIEQTMWPRSRPKG